MVYRLTTSILMMWLVFGSAAAEEETAPERYTVEIIVFQHLDQSRNTPETPAPSSMIPDSPLDLQVEPSRSLAGEALSGSAEYASRAPIEFHVLALKPEYPAVMRLEANNEQLNRTYTRLQSVDAYEPVVHSAWIHLAQGSEQAQPYTLSAPLPGAGEITGSVTLYKERYVHLELDITLTLPAATQVTESLQTTESSDKPATGFEAAPSKENGPQENKPQENKPQENKPEENGYEERLSAMIILPDAQYQLQESRRVRNGEPHYFDHPQFGVIAVVQVIETQTDEVDSNSSLN